MTVKRAPVNQPIIFSMEKGRIVEPLSSDWFKTISFGDVIKLAGMIMVALAAFVKLQADLDHERELRQLLEGRTAEVTQEIRNAQKENSDRIETRFVENASRDRELFNDFKARMDRIETKIDNLAQRKAAQ